jgi:hypothetical protein
VIQTAKAGLFLFATVSVHQCGIECVIFQNGRHECADPPPHRIADVRIPHEIRQNQSPESEERPDDLQYFHVTAAFGLEAKFLYFRKSCQRSGAIETGNVNGTYVIGQAIERLMFPQKNVRAVRHTLVAEWPGADRVKHGTPFQIRSVNRTAALRR